jgi:hypothetical protein
VYTRLNLLIVTSTLITLAVISVSAWAWFGKPAKTNTHQPVGVTRHSTTNMAQGQSSSEHIEVELVTLNHHGFEPREITRPRGTFRLRTCACHV